MSELVLKFPDGFMWGSATASYQIEGGHEDGRSPCIWDTFCAKEGNVKNGDNGSVACDHYHRWKEDVALMKQLGLPSYRFSISWSRLLPAGRGEVNPKGLEFYNNLINELVANDITPLVTLYHWDLPECLEAEYGGWLSRKVIDDFAYYAKTCFKCFGDRVKNWITFNEPWCSTVLGYCNGEMAPGRKEMPAEEPYLAAHHIILAHAKAVKCYRDKFKTDQKGVIGITLNMDWREPLTDKPEDIAAAGRALDWQLGWYADPIWKGDYPETMKTRCGDRLPSFTDEEKALIKGTSDFFGLNHYSTAYVSNPVGEAKSKSMWGNVQSGGYFDDQQCTLTDDPRWPRTDMQWAVVPWGLKSMCEYIQKVYEPEGGILVTENGCAVQDDDVEKAKQDTPRVNFYRDYIAQLHKAIENGADVRGYFAWSLMDNFEWALGYSKRFGMCHVDYNTQVRTPKASALFVSGIIQQNAVNISVQDLAGSDFVMIENGHGVVSAKDNPDSPEKAKTTTVDPDKVLLAVQKAKSAGRLVLLVSVGSLSSGEMQGFRNKDLCHAAWGAAFDSAGRSRAHVGPLIVVSLGDHKDALVGLDVPANAICRPAIPEADIIRAGVDCFVMDGGQNSLLEGLAHGAPFVVCPRASDQLAAAEKAESMGVGMSVARPASGPGAQAEYRAAVAAAVVEVLGNRKYLHRVKEVAQRFSSIGGAAQMAEYLSSGAH